MPQTTRLQELTVRYTVKRDSRGRPIALGHTVTTPRDSAAILVPLLQHEPTEVFAILCLCTKRRVIAYHEVSRGTLDTTLVHPREVFRPPSSRMRPPSSSPTSIRAATPHRVATISTSPVSSQLRARRSASTSSITSSSVTADPSTSARSANCERRLVAVSRPRTSRERFAHR